MKQVLVIAYYFPPLGMGGVRRVVNFCRYLPRFGWSPRVLTVKPIRYFAYDRELVEEVKCKIHRSESADPLRMMRILGIGKKFGKVRRQSQRLSDFLFIPDNKIGWLPFTVNKGIRLIKDIDVIFSTAPPYSGLLVGWMLKKLSGVPLVIEFRDPWPYYKPYATLFHRWVNEYLKKKIMGASDTIITISEPIKASLQSTVYGPQSTVVIPAGYRIEDFQGKREKSDRFTIVYTGSFIPPRTPIYFLEALSGLIVEGKIKPKDIRVKIIGFSVEATPELPLRNLGLESVVQIEPYRPHRYCVEQIHKADALWIMMDAEEKGVSPGKIGEYLGARRPILATIPESPCADIIRETKSGVVVPPRNIEAIKEAIYDFYSKFKEGKLENPPENKVKEYSWVELTKKLARIFDNLTIEKSRKNVDK